MSTDSTQYTAAYQQGQEAIRKATEAWSRSFTAAVRPATGFSAKDAEDAVDRFFDLNEKFLDAQRQFAKRVMVSLTEASATAAEKAQQFASA